MLTLKTGNPSVIFSLRRVGWLNMSTTALLIVSVPSPELNESAEILMPTTVIAAWPLHGKPSGKHQTPEELQVLLPEQDWPPDDHRPASPAAIKATSV